MARKSKGTKKDGGLVKLAMRTGINRGVFGDSKGWLYVGTGLWTLRTVRKLAARKPEILLREEIKPGERLIIANDRGTLDAVVGAAAQTADGAPRRSKR
jgi:hypothetical protein